MQDSCQTDWNFWQDKIKFCRTGGLSVNKLLSLFARNHRTFVRQTEIFCTTEWKFASFVRQSCSFREDWLNRISHTIYWKSPISILGMLLWDLDIPKEKWLNDLQTVETLIRRRILRRLIRVCTVCQLPFYGSPDYNGLKQLMPHTATYHTDFS